jgi:hypothetical protein
MTRSLRRSRRAPKKGNSAYNEGDIVQASTRNFKMSDFHNGIHHHDDGSDIRMDRGGEMGMVAYNMSLFRDGLC